MESSIPELPEKKKAFLQSMAAKCAEAGEALTNSTKTLSTGYNMPAMFNNKKYSDILLKLHGDEEVYHCHKSILASHSLYFDQVFEGNARLSQPGTVLVLQGPEELQPIYKRVLEFLYTGKVTFHKYDVFMYYFMAELIACADLQLTCARYLKNRLQVKLKDWQMMPKSNVHVYGGDSSDSGDDKMIGSLNHTEQVSVLKTADNTYSATEVLSLWHILSHKDICYAASLWIASQISYRSSKRVTNFTVDKVDLVAQLTLEQLSAVLDCDVQPISEFKFFTFVTRWHEANPEQNAEALLLKIRYAYMSIEERDAVLKSKYVKAAPLVTQTVILACFYFDKLLKSKRELEAIKETFPEYQKKVYQPRKYNT